MEPRKEQQSEPGKEVKKPKRRFQIVKLEERIAPAGNGKSGANDQCNAGYGGGYSHHRRCF
jgi:hypothetical protein